MLLRAVGHWLSCVLNNSRLAWELSAWPYSDADTNETELAEEGTMSVSLKPFDCTMTTRKRASSSSRLARRNSVCTCGCTHASNQFASVDPFANVAHGAFGYGRSTYSANYP